MAENETPSREQLAAYVDGELDDATRRQVEAWLARHPEAAAEVQAQRRLARLWQMAVLPEPSDLEWAALLARVESGLAVPSRQEAVAPPRGRFRGGVAIGGAAAAAVLLALLWFGRPVPPQPAADESLVPLPVAAAGDVEIISMDGADLSALVVGEPPLREPLVLAAADEVELENVEPDRDGMVPQVHLFETPSVPMIVVPLDDGAARAP